METELETELEAELVAVERRNSLLIDGSMASQEAIESFVRHGSPLLVLIIPQVPCLFEFLLAPEDKEICP